MTLETLILAIFASSGIWSLITILVQHHFTKKASLSEEQRKMNKLVLGLGHDRICFLGMAYVDRGYITKDEYEDLVTYLYQPYKDLEGDGTAELVIEKVKQLPIKSTKEAASINSTQICQKTSINTGAYSNIIENPVEFR